MSCSHAFVLHSPMTDHAAWKLIETMCRHAQDEVETLQEVAAVLISPPERAVDVLQEVRKARHMRRAA